MGSDSVKETAPLSYTEVFGEVFPAYLAIGMTYEQFWEKDPELAVFYRKAHDIKKDMTNQWLWLMGEYVNVAFSTSLANAFRKEGSRPIEYLKEPLPIREKTQTQKEIEIEKKKQALISFFEQSKKQYDKERKK